jgi:hypothetical protein
VHAEFCKKFQKILEAAAEYLPVIISDLGDKGIICAAERYERVGEMPRKKGAKNPRTTLVVGILVTGIERSQVTSLQREVSGKDRNVPIIS